MISKEEQNHMNINKRELGIYVHIPFCVQKCNYCDFLSFASSQEIQEKYIYALLNEMTALKNKFSNYTAPTIFIGGGTPSILEPRLLNQLLHGIKNNYTISDNVEFTIECNPGTLNIDKIKIFKEYGINRISLGLQSADNKELKNLGRIHTFEDFLYTFELLRTEGFNNINIDLMSALPYQTPESWENTLDKIIRLNPEHISAYSLIVEEGTKLYDRITNEEANEIHSLPSEETERSMYYKTQEILQEAGYLQYEISNYAKTGYVCMHNISYWIRKNYLGLGLGAASLIDNLRYSNTQNLRLYIDNSNMKEKLQVDIKNLSKKEQMEEFMFLGLRLIEGVSIKKFNEIFCDDFMDVYGDITTDLIKKNLIKIYGDTLSLTSKGLDLSNYVMSHYLQ